MCSLRSLLYVVLLAMAVSAQVRGAAADDGAARPRLSVPYTQFTLPNGLRVVLHEDHSVPVVAVNVWYHVGSGPEKPGRTGFAHLFEHLMFEGSGHVKEGDFDNLLEGAGGDNNGSTNADRTNDYLNVPSSALELALFLESDRMGYLLDAMSPGKVDGQRDVVKNERRQGVENQPYGQAFITLSEMLFPDGHPYHWPTIGYMDDLTPRRMRMSPISSNSTTGPTTRRSWLPATSTLPRRGRWSSGGSRRSRGGLTSHRYRSLPPS